MTDSQREPTSAFNERWLLLLLAAIQFTTVLDFLIIMPLGPQYIRVFGISPGQFGIIVSAYAISAGFAGLAASVVLDRFERKRALLTVYLGFVLGTFLCAIAPSYLSLIGARVVAGAFGGVAASLILAIVGDVIPYERRGRAMGMIMSSFSLASVLGVPIGLVVAAHYSWHFPFLGLAILSLVICFLGLFALPVMQSHLGAQPVENPFARILTIVRDPGRSTALIFTAFLTLNGYLIFPHISNYMVANVGLTEHQLPLIYLCGGACTMLSLNLIGKWADRVGKHRVFLCVSISAFVPILLLTNLPQVPVPLAIAVSTLFMICMSGRMVPAMALVTGSVEPRYRGAFMSINSSVQQFAGGLGASIGGIIVGQSADGKMINYPYLGILAIVSGAISMYISRSIKVGASTDASQGIDQL